LICCQGREKIYRQQEYGAWTSKKGSRTLQEAPIAFAKARSRDWEKHDTLSVQITDVFTWLLFPN
jgi:hypothetical protein